MIDRNTKFINRFIIVLSVIIFIEVLNFIVNLYVSINDIDGYTVVDIISIIKFIGLVTLFISLLWWKKDKTNNLLKYQVVVHTKYVFVISIFYYLTLYLYKYSIILNVLDILKNKMIEGNPALLLSFAKYSYTTLNYVQGVYQNFNSEAILTIELLFILWNLRNFLTLKTVKEETVKYDSFLYTNYLKYFSLALILFSFLSINLFEYVFDLINAIMFLVSFFLFSIQLPLYHFLRRLSNLENDKITKNEFMSLHKLSLFLSLISMIGFIIYFGILIYALSNGINSYRLVSTFISIILSFIIFKRILYTMKLTNK